MMAALAASGAECMLLTDGPLGKSNSLMAQGGLQMPLETDASAQLFCEDILRSARVALDTALVRNFVAHVAETVHALEAWGLMFDRDVRGNFVRRLAGGLSEPRIVSVRDQIGPALIKVLRDQIHASPIEVREHCRVCDLAPDGGIFRLFVSDAQGRESELRARAVICCTGGTTYREAQRRQVPTTNPENINHELFDRLVRLGLPTVHADFFQYQPFGIVGSERDAVGRCVPESIVNFGVRILDREGLEIGDIRQDRYALTQRMFEVIAAGRGVPSDTGGMGLWLTLGDVPVKTIEETFPKVHRYLTRSHQLGQNILIHPFLHYHLGGFRITPQCESALPGLFVAGEMTGGLHGRNRLMGNGITDSLVHGRIAGTAAAAYVRH
jgi:succinate dehydrogenase/fumarate reductase flavoprotein subunit